MLNAKYTFIPWLKQGLGLYTSVEDNFSYNAGIKGRPLINAKVKVNNNIEVSKDLELVGPGDVIGFETSGILKSWPQEATPDFQPNNLAFIEFYEEDLPWRYTPAVAIEQNGNKHKLRPWMALVVLVDGEYNFERSKDNRFSVLQVDSNTILQAFPEQKDLWAWAHVQINGHFNNVNDLKDLADGAGEKVYSRIMCPRKLRANTAYRAFLIPSFEAGRMIGLGEEPYDAAGPDVLSPAWDKNDLPSSISFPVYHTWSFSTSENEDFESLIDRMQPQEVPDEVGNLLFDVRQMGSVINTENTTTTHLGMPGPLKAFGSDLVDWDAPNVANGKDDADVFKSQLMAWINQADILRQTGTYTPAGNMKSMFGESDEANDPVITPPLYGRFQALVKKLYYQSTLDSSYNNHSGVEENPQWIKDLNLEPRNRIAASIGASIVREHQEELMDAAWEQVGDILEVNQRIIQAELAKNVNYEAYRKFVYEADDGKIIELSGSMVKKLLSGNQTVWKEVTGSTLPNASLSGQFRSKKKARGKKASLLNAKLSNQSVKFEKNLVNNIADVTKKEVDAALPKLVPETAPNYTTLNSLREGINTIEQSYATDPGFSNAFYPKPADDGSGGLVSANALQPAVEFLDEAITLPTLTPLSVSSTKTKIVDSLDPNVSHAKRLNGMLGSVGGTFKIVDDSYRFKPVLATPEFDFPVYEILKEKSVDLFLPNLDKVPNNTISILESNYEFIEALLVGMSHELGKELLWRSFPTDQRGTNFKHFWERYDSQTFEPIADISQIHTWTIDSKLGDESHRASDGQEEVGVVLMLRGDLLKQYPNTVLFAQQAENESYPNRTPKDYDNSAYRKYPVFEAKIEPDITFFGFNISVDEALGDAQGKGGWFFVFQERPGDIAFGFDKADNNPGGKTKAKWEDIDWDDILPSGFGVLSPEIDFTHQNGQDWDDIEWGKNSADIAYSMFQKPVRVAIHAAKMINA